MKYKIWQDLPQVTVGPIEYFPVRKLPFARGEWHHWNLTKDWILDFACIDGMQCGTRIDGIEKTFTRKSRMWHLYAPGIHYRERYASHICHEDMWLHFSFARPWLPLSARKHAVISDPEERICNHVRAMYAIQHFDQLGSSVTLQGLMIAVLGELATASRAGGSGTPEDPWRVAPPDCKVSGEENLLTRVDSAIQSNLDDNLSLDELAERLQMSLSSLVHRFKAETGMTVVQRRRWLRIREARRLLALPGATVKTVAQRLNFSSPFYFSRVFSELVGLSPQDYMLKSQRRR